MSNWKKTMLASAGGGDYWIIDSINYGSNAQIEYPPAVDSSGNIYVHADVFNEDGNSLWKKLRMKISPDGTIIWQKITARYSSDNHRYGGVCIDDNDNVYWVSTFWTSSFNTTYFLVEKTDTDNVSISKRQFDDGGGRQFLIKGEPTIDNNNSYLYIPYVSTWSSTSNPLEGVERINMSGSTPTRVGGTYSYLNTNISYGFNENATDPLRFVGFQNPDYFGYTARNSDMAYTSRWKTTTSDYGQFSNSKFAVDDSGNSYLPVRFITGPGGNERGILKINSSGTRQWASYFDVGPLSTDINYFNLSGSTLATENGTDYIYGRIWVNSGTYQYHTGLFKMRASDGNFEWCNLFKISGGSRVNTYLRSFSSAAVDANGDLYITGYNTTGTDYFYIAKLPPDGSITGTFGDYTFQSVTPTSTGTVTTNTSSHSNGWLTNGSALDTNSSTVFSYSKDWTHTLNNTPTG
jgi:hypothetical protein